MKPVDLDSAAGRIHLGLKDLGRVWEESAQEWEDPVSRAFHKERLEPMVPIVKNALDAIGRMRTLLHQAQRELEDGG